MPLIMYHYVCIHHRNEPAHITMLAPFLQYLYCEPQQQPQHALLRHSLLRVLLPVHPGAASLLQAKEEEKPCSVSDSLLHLLCQLVPRMQVTQWRWNRVHSVSDSRESTSVTASKDLFVFWSKAFYKGFLLVTSPVTVSTEHLLNSTFNVVLNNCTSLINNNAFCVLLFSQNTGATGVFFKENKLYLKILRTLTNKQKMKSAQNLN